MIKREQVVEFLDSNDYYGLDEMADLLTDIVNDVYDIDTLKEDVQEFVEHND